MARGLSLGKVEITVRGLIEGMTRDPVALSKLSGVSSLTVMEYHLL
jgi:hypothetical protein